MTKSQIASELAEKTGQKSKTILTVLDGLTEIAYREAVNGFVVPGICKLSVTTRKARRFRHPISKQLFLIAARQSLSITALKKCRNSAASVQDTILTPIEENSEDSRPPEAPPATEHAQASPPPPEHDMQAPPPLSSRNMQAETEGCIVFACEQCGNTISSPAETAGMAGECPFCNGEIVIPISSPTPHRQPDEPTPDKLREPADIMGFVTFVCHSCHQEIEAPDNMIGIQAACPSCGSSVYVPAEDDIPARKAPQILSQDKKAQKPDLRSMTIRMDLSDII